MSWKFMPYQVPQREDLDDLVGFVGRLVEENVEGEVELVAEARRRRIDAVEIAEQVAEIGKQHGTDELEFAAGDAVDHVALRADNFLQVGHFPFAIAEFLDHVRLGMLGDEDGVLQCVDFLREVVEHGLVGIDHGVEEEVGQAVHAARDGGRIFLDAFDRAGDHGKRFGVVGDEERFADEEVELAGAELVLLVEGDGVHDEVEIILVVLDLRIAAGRHRILDRQRVEGKNFFHDRLAFLGRRLREIDPDEQALVGTNQPQGIRVKITPNQFTIVKDKGVNHKRRRSKKREG
jgi:hypothetical protein